MPQALANASEAPTAAMARAADARAAVMQLSRALPGEAACPDDAWHVYVDAASIDELHLHQIELSLDGGRPQVKVYDAIERRALRSLGIDRAFCIASSGRLHTAQIDIAATRGDADSEDASAMEAYRTLELALDPATEARHVVLDIRRPPWRFGSLRISADWRSGGEFHGPRDPRLQYARYLTDAARPLHALDLLRAMPARDDADFLREWHWSNGEALAAFAQYDEARQRFRDGDGAFDKERRVQALLTAAESELMRGATQGARETLSLLPVSIRSLLEVRRRDLLSRTYLAEGNFEQALRVLASDDEDGMYLYTPYMRFNVGLALMHAGAANQAILVLERVGQIFPADDAEAALRDRANVLLGEHFLRREQGGTAKPYFLQVRLQSPYTARALLGLGWSEVSPLGETEERQPLARRYDDRAPLSESAPDSLRRRYGYYEADTAESMRMMRYLRIDLEDEADSALGRAMVPWLLLARDYRDRPSAVEGSLAVAYAQEQKGDDRQALARYRESHQLLERIVGEMNDMRRAIDGGAFWASMTENGQAPYRNALSGWLLEWAAGQSLHRHLAEYQALADLRRELLQRAAITGGERAEVTARIEPVRQSLDAAMAAQQQAAEQHAVRELKDFEQRLAGVRIGTVESMAKLQDRMSRVAPP